MNIFSCMPMTSCCENQYNNCLNSLLESSNGAKFAMNHCRHLVFSSCKTKCFSRKEKLGSSFWVFLTRRQADRIRTLEGLSIYWHTSSMAELINFFPIQKHVALKCSSFKADKYWIENNKWWLKLAHHFFFCRFSFSLPTFAKTANFAYWIRRLITTRRNVFL